MEENKYKLSFLQRGYVDVTVLKVLSPARFLVKEAASIHGSEESKAFKMLEEAMDMYYKTYQMEICELPCSGSIVVVCPDQHWYRGRVEAILDTTVGPRVLVYLLDYGKTVNVEKSFVRKPFPKLREVPFQALEFQLYALEPCSLIMKSDCLMDYGQVEQWDTAAKEFVKNIITLKRCARMNTIHIDSNGVLHGELLVSIDEELTSLNKELMNNHFATKTEKANKIYEMTGRKCSNVGMNLMEEEKQKQLFGAFKSCTSEEHQSRNTVSLQQALLKKLNRQSKQENLENNLNKKELGTPTGNENEKFYITTRKTQMQLNDIHIRQPEASFSVNRYPGAISLNNAPQCTRKESIISVGAKDEVMETNKQTVSSSCSSLGVKCLQRLGSEMHYIHTGHSANKSNENHNKQKVKDPNNEHDPLFRMIGNYSKEDSLVIDSKSALDSSTTQRTAGNICNTHPGKLEHLQLMLQKSHWKPKQELQNICQVQKSVESNLDPSNKNTNQNEISNTGKTNNVLGITNSAVGSSNEYCLPFLKNLSTYKSTGMKSGTSYQCNQSALTYSPEEHIFNKFLNKLHDFPKGAITTEKDVFVNNEENFEFKMTENCGVSPAKCNVNAEIYKNNQNISTKLPHSVMLKQSRSKNLPNLESIHSCIDNKFELNKGKQLKQIQQNNNISKVQIDQNSTIAPKNMLLNAHFETTMDKQEGIFWDNDKITQIVCYGKGMPKPFKCVASAGFNASLVQSLKDMHFQCPLPVQTRMWPSILRGRSIVSVSSPHTGKTFGYLLPLLSHILEPSLYSELPDSNGPLALILCSSWKKAQHLHDHCRILLDKCNQVKVLVTYGGGCEKLQKMSLINGCDVLIATPPSFLRLLQSTECRILDLKRCCYLVIDDGNAVLDLFKEEIVDIVKEYGRCLRNRKHLAIPNQIILCCKQWNNDVSSFTHHCMTDPLILIASPFEAAVYARVFTYCHFSTKSQIYSVLADIIAGSTGKRVVICTSDDTSAKTLHQFLQNMSVYTILALSSTLHYELNGLLNEWNSLLSPDTVHVLVTTDVLLDMGISNANCLIQCNLESVSRIDFCQRFSCMADNYSSEQQTKSKKFSNCICHLLLTEECVDIIPTLVNLVKRLPSKIPQKLHLIANERKLQTSNSELCYYLKAYGKCPNLNTCKDCHTISKEINNLIELPRSGKVRVLICYVIDAIHYYARIIEHSDLFNSCMLSPSSYLNINLKLMEYYSVKENCIKEDVIEVGKVCVVERAGSTYHRVRIEEIVQYNGLRMPRRVKLHYLDEGWQEVDDTEKLLKIPSDLAAYPFQVVEVYICNIQPIDKCYEWTPQGSTFVHNMIGDKEMTGVIMLTLGCAMWLDPLVHYVQIDKSDIVLKESNVRTALIREGLAITNCCHIENLYTLCNGIITLPQNNLETKPLVSCNTQQAFLELNEVHCVYVYTIENPELFFIQRHDRADLIDNLQKELQDLHKKSKLEKLERVQKGLICIAPFSEDNNYYRACIEEVYYSKDSGEADEQVNLFFVDFGDTGLARKKDLYCIPSKCLLLPFQAIECSLGGIMAPHGGWSDNISDIFDSLTVTDDEIRKPLFLKVLKKKSSSYSNRNHYIVKLCEEGSTSCLSQALLNKGLGIPVNLPQPETNDAISCDDNLTEEEAYMADAMCSAISLETSLAKTLCEKKEKSHPNKAQTTKNKENHRSEVQTTVNHKIAGCFETLLAETLYEKKENYTSEVQTINKKQSHPNKVQTTVSHETDGFNSEEAFSSYERINIPPLTQYSIGYTIPQVLWWQKKDEIRLSIQLTGVKSIDAVFKEKNILFTTKVNGKLYRFEEDLFDSINPNKSRKSLVGNHVELTLPKLKFGLMWPRLTACSKKRPYIRANFDYLSDNSSDSEPLKVIKTNREDIVHFESSDVEYSTDDDDEWHRDDGFYYI